MSSHRTRKILSILFFTFAGLSAIGGLIFYAFVSAMACAFTTSGRGCRTKMPWDLNSEDFMLMVAIPGLIVLGFVTLGLLCRRRQE